MQVRTVKEAWELANKLFPTDYMKDEQSSQRAGYLIYISTAEGNESWISDLGNRLELNIWKDGGLESTNIWIEQWIQREEEKEESSIKWGAAVVMEHFNSDDWDDSEKARTQDQLQAMAKQIRANCKAKKIHKNGDYRVCTEYENENLGIRYWVHDKLGRISEIVEGRYY